MGWYFRADQLPLSSQDLFNGPNLHQERRFPQCLEREDEKGVSVNFLLCELCDHLLLQAAEAPQIVSNLPLAPFSHRAGGLAYTERELEHTLRDEGCYRVTSRELLQGESVE